MFLISPQKAFSLVELMIVISIIGLLSAVSLGSLNVMQKNSRDAQRQADLRLLQGGIQQFYADNNAFPNSLQNELTNGLPITDCSGKVGTCTPTKTYLSRVPKDPQGTAYYYRPVISVDKLGDSCGVGVGVCQYYILCAKLENPAPGASCYDSGYNLQVTPL